MIFEQMNEKPCRCIKHAPAGTRWHTGACTQETEPAALHVECDRCSCTLTVPGALVFGIPVEGQSRKRHLCFRCAPLLDELFNSVGYPEPTFDASGVSNVRIPEVLAGSILLSGINSGYSEGDLAVTQVEPSTNEPPCGSECVGCQIDKIEDADKQTIARLTEKLRRSEIKADGYKRAFELLVDDNMHLRNELSRWIARIKHLESLLESIRSLLP